MEEYTKRLSALSPEQRRLFELRMKHRESHAFAEQHESTFSSATHSEVSVQPEVRSEPAIDRKMRFSIFYFSDIVTANDTDNKYRLLLETAKFADQHGFEAIWVPERHFQEFGGLYPNPTVLAAALAMVTSHVQLRAGSLVLPLHNPIRVAEDWSVIDNLSQGRVAISLAAGWHPADFVLAPASFAQRKEVMFQGIETIRQLWRGEALSLEDAQGAPVEIHIQPRPLQPSLPIWVTTSGHPATWSRAGEIGAHVLAALIGQSFEDLAGKIALYRESLECHGHDPAQGRVSLMLHTFLGEDDSVVKEQVREPLKAYIATFMKQHEGSATGQEESIHSPEQVSDMKQQLLDFAFERYFNAYSLLGTLPRCARLIDRLQQIGVDEVACLIDFGLDLATILQGMQRLVVLKEQYE